MIRLITKEKYVLRFDFLIYDPSKFEFECPFSDYVIFLDIRIFAIMHETALSRPNGMEKYPEFFLRVRGDPNDEIDHKNKYMHFDSIFWYDLTKFEFEPFCYL